MFDNHTSIKFWCFCKFLLVYLSPIIVASIIISETYVRIYTISYSGFLAFVVGIIVFIPCLFLVLKFINKMFENDKIWDWIEKPWNGFNFK